MKSIKHLLILPLLFTLSGCFDSSPSHKVVELKDYRCRVCKGKNALNDFEKFKPATENLSKNFQTVITHVEMGQYIPCFETARLQFREFTMDDVDDVSAFRSRPTVAQSGVFAVETKKKTEEQVRKWTEGYRRGESTPWAVVEKKTGRVIGHGGIVENYGKRVIVGWILHDDVWGQGYGTEMARGVIELCFMATEAVRVEAVVRIDNIGSRRVLEKAGMSLEGTMRDYWFVKNEMLTMHQYAILKREVTEQLKKSVCDNYFTDEYITY